MEVLQCLLLAAVTVLVVRLQYEYWRRNRECLNITKTKITHIRKTTNMLGKSSASI